MASVTSTTWCPNSYQLRLAFKCRKSHTINVRTRFRKLDRQVRVFSVAQDGARNENQVEGRPNGSSWMSDSTADTVSGWTGSDVGEQSGEPERKRLSGVTIGAGLAGVVFVAGLTFATLSLSKRSTLRPQQEMEPITTQQEVSLASDDLNDRVEEDGNEGKDSIQDDYDLEKKTGIDMDSSSSPEFDEATIENNVDDDTNMGTSSVNGVKSTSNGIETIKNASIQEDLQYESAFGDMSVGPDTSPSSPNLPESETVDGSFVAAGFNEFDGSLAADTPESSPELKENLLDVEPTNLSVSDANPTHNTDHQEGILDSSTTEIYNLPNDSSFSSTPHISSEPVSLSVSVSSQIDAILEPQSVPKDDIEIVSSPSNIKDLDLSKMPHVSAEGNNPSLEVQNFNESGSFGTMSVSTLAYPIANEQDAYDPNAMNGSKLFFESPGPGNSFSSAGIPAPSLVSAALQVLPGNVLVPAVVDQVQGQALAALQVLKVIEADVQPGDLCTRREYARWLVSGSSALSRNTASKVYPAMYIENVTELAFDDITPEDPDFPSIQGLAEAGLISSKLSRHDMLPSLGEEDQSPFFFYPECPLSRQDLVSWKMALEKRQLPEADKKIFYQLSGFIDIGKINPGAWPSLVADISSGEQGIIALAFGYTRLFQPDKPVTKAQAAIALATGEASDVVSEELARIEAESMAENAVAAHSALVAQVEKDINANFETVLLMEKEKIDAVEKMAEEAIRELEKLRAQREEDGIALMKERAAVESEMEILSRLRGELEEQMQSLMSNKVEISYEKERISKLRKDAENENQEISRLQYELEVERKALSMARSWAEDEAKRAREQAKALELARDRWERHGIKVVVDSELSEASSGGVTWLNAGSQSSSVEASVDRAETLVDKLKTMGAVVKGKSRETIDKIIEKILLFISVLKEWACEAGSRAGELKEAAVSKARVSAHDLQQSSVQVSLAVKEGVKRVAGDCREGVEKLTQKFKA